jgi:Predicted signal-transduction protein containing cAMP-binding and CBS domains
MNDSDWSRLLMRIGSAEDARDLRGMRNEIYTLSAACPASGTIDGYYRRLNAAHDAIVRRAIRLAEAETARSGIGSPPVPYAYMLFGSGGRGEQTHASDQDSGLVYESRPERAEEAETYFAHLSGTVVRMLVEAGYPPCEGNVISRNPAWRRSLGEWKRQLDEWFADPTWEAVRYLLIVADGRCVAGDERLVRELKEYYYGNMPVHPVIVGRMLDNTMRHKVLVGVFGQLLKERYGEDSGSLDVKYGAYIPMVNAVRLLAVQAGLHETSTLRRLERLREAGWLDEDEKSAYEMAFLLFLRLRLMTTERTEDGVRTSNGMVSAAKLTKDTVDELKEALRIGKRLQRVVRKRTLGKPGGPHRGGRT